MKTTALFLLLPLGLLAQDAFEQPPTLSAAAILKPEFAAGAGFAVRDPVPTYGGRNGYMIDSDAGTLVLRGGEPLALHAWPPDVQVVSAATPLGGHLRVGRRPHLIHAHEAKAGYFGLLHHMLFRSPYVLTRQVPFPVRDRYWSQRVYAKASRVVAISPHVRDQVAASLRAPAAIDVIANAVSYRPSNGLLRAELASDAVHLNDAGYRLWAQQLTPLLLQKD